MRIDKLLSNLSYGSRKEVHQLIKSGVVKVNGKVIKNKDLNINPDIDEITVNDEIVKTQLVYYLKMNKPSGYITATKDNFQKTIMDLLPADLQKLGVKPVGRLDKDTEGLILLTNDGNWAHRIINGKKDIEKCYYFKYVGTLIDKASELVLKGLILDEDFICKPAKLELIENNAGLLTITEGKYHQVKRMIQALGGEVIYLKRLSIDIIELEDLVSGEFKELSLEEIAIV